MIGEKAHLRSLGLILFSVLAAGLLSTGVEAQTPELALQTGHSGDIDALVFSHNGRYLFSGSYDQSLIALLRMRDH